MKLIQNDTYRIALEVTGCNGMVFPFYASKIVECSNLELLHAILTCALPFQFVSKWHHEKRTQEFISKLSMFETNLSASDGYLIKSPKAEYLASSEKSANAYHLGLIFSKLFSMKEFDTDYFLHTSLFEQVYGIGSFDYTGYKKPAFAGYRYKTNEWSVWETTGKREKAPKALEDAYHQVSSVLTVNGQAPYNSIACMTYFDTKHGELQAIIRNTSPGNKGVMLFDKEQYLTLYYRHICELFDESLRKKPFDSVTDYVEGYLEIELELFGLNAVEEDNDKDEYPLIRKVKLGIPKDIFAFFLYDKELFSPHTTLTSIVDALNIDAATSNDKNFFMGKDGIYLRMV